MLSATRGDVAPKPVVTTTRAASLVTVVIAAPELLKRKGLDRCFSGKAGFAMVRYTSSLDDIVSCCRRLAPGDLIFGQDQIEGAHLAQLIWEAKCDGVAKTLAVAQQSIRGTVPLI